MLQGKAIMQVYISSYSTKISSIQETPHHPSRESTVIYCGKKRAKDPKVSKVLSLLYEQGVCISR